MAPPLASKRALPSEPPDARNRVSKPKPKSGRISRAAAAKTHLLLATGDAFEKGVTNPRVSHNSSVDSQQGVASLMEAIKGLLDLTNDYLKNLEIQHPGIGADFLALLADGASRAMRGERVYCSVPKPVPTYNQSSKDTWAEKAKFQSSGSKILNVQRLTINASPPQGQSKEDRCTIQKLVPDSSLVTDAWIVPSGIAVLAPTPAKAAAILQAKKAIEDRFGNAFVERQEVWITFVIGPIHKRIKGLDILCDPMDGLLQEELAHINDVVPMREMGWTRRSQKR
ncbi:hypothetical protein EV44_g3862 [Erysiphe necator]|uniref:Uncharacterized protein n=1 Tax=Uncinula necator TaxID=52586 RepID=A0A0B1PCR3_UNCNE|nr:hypothetical protein EV44_g3862 [Erysiphe necator]